MAFEEWKQYLKTLGCGYEADRSLRDYTTFRIGGNCPLIITPFSTGQVADVLRYAAKQNIDLQILGRGSNILASDEGTELPVLVLSTSISDVRLVDETTIYAQAGASLTKLCRFAQRHALSGLEFAYGIPGTVGGAIYMNAGAYGGEIKDVLYSSEYVNRSGEICSWWMEEHCFSYRYSRYMKTNYCITSAEFRLKKKDPECIQAEMDDFMQRRQSKQPLEYPSAGSTFKRPKGNYASALIEQCGLKGLRVGGAEVSQKHSGFVINVGDATSADVEALVEEIKQRVYAKTGYRLEEEIRRIP